ARHILAYRAGCTLQRGGVMHGDADAAADRRLTRRVLGRHHYVQDANVGASGEASDPVETDVGQRVIARARSVPGALRRVADEATHSHVRASVHAGGPDDALGEVSVHLGLEV